MLPILLRLPRLAGLCLMLGLVPVARCDDASAPRLPTLAELVDMRQALPAHPLRVSQILPSPTIPASRGNDGLDGITRDYLDVISDFLDLPLEEVPYTSVEDAIEGLRTGEIDILTRATGFELDQPGLAGSLPYLDNEPIIVGRGDDNSLSPDLNGKRVALLDHYASLGAARHAFPHAEVETVRSTAEGLRRLAEGRVDAFIGDTLRAGFEMRAHPHLGLQNKFAANLPSPGFAFATRDDNRTLLALIDHVLATTPPERRDAIRDRWTRSGGLFAPTGPFALTPRERDWLARHDSLTLIAQELPPYLYRTRDGQWTGLSVNILRSLTDAFALRLDILDSQSPALDREWLEQDRAQVATSLLADAVAWRGMATTDPFSVQSWTFIVREQASSPSSLEAMHGRRLVLPGNHPLRAYVEQRYPDIELVHTDTIEESLQLLANGRADASLATPQGADRHRRWLSSHGLRAGQRIEAMPQPQMFVISPGSPELLGILNKLQNSLELPGETGNRLRLLADTRHERSLWDSLPGWFWQSALLVLVIAGLSMLWNWRLRHQVRQRRIAQNQLSDQLAFQFSLLNGLPTPLYVRDLEGRLSTCNRAYEQFFGSSLEELRGTTPLEQGMEPHSQALELQQAYACLLEDRQPRFLDCCIEVRGQRHDLYQWLVPFYSARGKLQGLLGGWIDISDRKQLEDQLREARQTALEASAAKGKFLATMSHELRTPLNALVGLLELETAGPGRTSENLRIAQQSAHSMIDLIGNILDLDKIETGQMQLAPQPTSLEPLLRGSLELFAAQAREKGLALELDYPLATDRRYRLDPLKLRQVLHNLLGNALKFTARGHVTLGVTERETEPGQSLLTFQVSDSGIGIPRDIQPRIFEPYLQAHAEVAHLYGGSGLGLNICHRLVELMGGRIWLDSDPGQGCRVSFEIPLEQAPDDAAQPALTEQRATPAASALKVLIVDDVSTNGLVLQQQLASLGHQGTFVCSGEAALQAWEDGDFDVLISDCNMPGMDGYALARAVRAQERTQGLEPRRIIGYTASALADEAARCHAAGMDELMIKPVTLARLDEVLGDAPLPQAAAAGFDLSHLEGLQGADPALLARLLGELRGNLLQERNSLLAPLPVNNPQAIGQRVHRLGGLACTIDAPGLMRACTDLQVAMEQGPAALHEQQARLLDTLDGLLRDIEARLAQR
ncbi:ATP-binding protein [Pseudomonas sp. Q1-7]|uniref:ATP-binding protein n=1 Tax=Pseudomonas sp. Q1-7 TaxID=3020843 RepID=UPI002301579F|nr:transporter substrate-binding domain-containing protein [Pseudomonas sp. Q1-7]